MNNQHIPTSEKDDISQLSDKLDDLLPEFVRLVTDRLLAEPVSTVQPLCETNSVGSVPENVHRTSTSDMPSVTPVQAYLLRQIRLRGKCTAAQVGRILGITSGPVTSITQRLVQRGLLERMQDERDRRIMHFSLTELGRATVQEIHESMRSRWTLLLERLGTEKSAQLLSLLQDATAILQSWPEQK